MMRLPVIRGMIERRMLVNYRVRPEEATAQRGVYASRGGFSGVVALAQNADRSKKE